MNHFVPLASAGAPTGLAAGLLSRNTVSLDGQFPPVIEHVSKADVGLRDAAFDSSFDGHATEYASLKESNVVSVSTAAADRLMDEWASVDDGSL
jgi:hypothetical protein